MNARVRALSITAAAVLVVAAVAAGSFTLGRSSEQAPAPGATDAPRPIAAAVSGIVTDEEGNAIVASIEVTDEATARRARYQTDLLGRYDLVLEAGRYLIEFTKGYEFAPASIEVTIENRLRQRQEPVTMIRAIDLASLGWYGGDLHQHSSYQEGQQDVVEILASNLANGLAWGALTDHNTLDGLAEWERAGRISGATTDPFVAIPGLEVTTDRGHIIVLDPKHLIDHSTDNGTQDIERIIEEARADGATIQLNHPYLEAPMGFLDWPLHDRFDLLEVWNGKAPPPTDGTNEQTKQSWYELLNEGVYIPATGDSDNHDIGGGYVWEHGGDDDSAWMARGLFTGDPRTYVNVSGPVTQDAIIQALTAGRSFITNGPLLMFSLDGALPGEQVPASSGTASLSLDAFDRRGLTKAVLIENGAVAAEFPLDGTRQSVSVDIPVTPGSWYLIEGFGEDGGYAITNPVFIR